MSTPQTPPIKPEQSPRPISLAGRIGGAMFLLGVGLFVAVLVMEFITALFR